MLLLDILSVVLYYLFCGGWLGAAPEFKPFSTRPLGLYLPGGTIRLLFTLNMIRIVRVFVFPRP